MVRMSDIIPDIKVEAPECHTGLIQNRLIATLRHFCKETYYWRYELPAITLLAFMEQAPSTYFYTLSIPDNSEILAIDELIFEHRPLKMKSRAWLDENLPQWRESTGEPRYFIMQQNGDIRFVPASDRIRPIAVTGTVILQPGRSSTEIDDGLMRYDRCLIAGTLSRLLMMANKAWTDADRSQVYQSEYIEGLSQAKNMVMRDFSDGYEVLAKRSWLHEYK